MIIAERGCSLNGSIKVSFRELHHPVTLLQRKEEKNQIAIAGGYYCRIAKPPDLFLAPC